MWMIDERYWLLQSNKSLRTHIGNDMSKKDKKKYGGKRPDFVCGTFGNRLIVVELKRPGLTLKIGDMNQLEEYVTVAESYAQFQSYEAYLVGSKMGDDLKKRLKHRSRAFRLMSYAEIVDSPRQRYDEFLKSLDQ